MFKSKKRADSTRPNLKSKETQGLYGPLFTVILTNSADPGEMPQNVASHQGLQRLLKCYTLMDKNAIGIKSSNCCPILDGIFH